MQSESNEDLLVEAKHLYEKMLENITNKSITSLIENMSSVSTFAQQELCGNKHFILILMQLKMIRMIQPIHNN
jgi:hypothetical protein